MSENNKYPGSAEEKQMLDLLWDQYNEGEYADAATLAESMLESQPENVNALSVLALVYEKLAQANSEAGDTEGEREYLTKALDNYLRIISISHDSVAEQAKAEKLKKKLYGRKSRPSENISFEFAEKLKKAFAAFREKASAWYEENKGKRSFKALCVCACCAVFLTAGIISYAVSVHSSRRDAEKAAAAKTPAPAASEQYVSGAAAPPAAGNTDYGADYNGPMMTYTYQSPEYRAQLEEQQNNAKRREVRDPATLVDKGSHIKAGGSPQASETKDRKTTADWYATRREPASDTSRVPYSDFELRPSKESDEKTGEKANPLKVEREDVKGQEKEKEKPSGDGSARLKAANSLLKSAMKAADMGNYDEMRKNALAAKEIYQSERAKGNKPEFCKSNIDTINTLLGY